MIKATGKYLLSKDGGKTFKEFSNLLVTDYYQKTEGISLTAIITSNGNEPEFGDTTVSTGISSQAVNGFSDFSLEITQDSYKLNCSAVFNIGLGNSLVARDINILCNSNLYSRALFRDGDGNPIDIPITVKDNIIVKYILTYNLPRGEIPINVNIHNRFVQGVIKVCNPNIWGTGIMSRPIKLDNVGVAPQGTWVQDANGYIDSGLTSHIINLDETFSRSASLKKIIYTGIADLDKLNTTFRQIAFSSGTFSPRNIAILINLNEDVVNTEDDYLSLGIEVNQEAL